MVEISTNDLHKLYYVQYSKGSSLQADTLYWVAFYWVALYQAALKELIWLQ